MRRTPVALALGGNAADSETHLRNAIGALREVLAGIEVAPLYRTAALSPISQSPFLNTAVTGRTTLEPDQLLAVGKALERMAGRRRGPRFGPRPLDVDLLLFGRRTAAGPELTLPHPRLRERLFYLAPLADLAPDWTIPPGGPTVGEQLAHLAPGQAAERIGWPAPPPASGGG